MELYVGKKLIISIQGSKKIAEIINIKDSLVVVLIEGKKYTLKKDTIFKMYEKTKFDKESKKCVNCMDYINGECIGLKNICSEFRYAPKISKEEMDRWPKKAARTKADKYINREYDDEYISFRYGDY